MRLLRWFLCVLWSGALATAATAPRPNVILITLDTTRADRMGFVGSDRGLTPNLDALAQQSVNFLESLLSSAPDSSFSCGDPDWHLPAIQSSVIHGRTAAGGPAISPRHPASPGLSHSGFCWIDDARSQECDCHRL